jgi:hypothetical protein
LTKTLTFSGNSDPSSFIIQKLDKVKPLKPFRFKGLRYGGIKWARTIDLHDVNVAL